MPLPEAVAQHGNVVLPATVARRKCASKERLHAEHIEEIRLFGCYDTKFRLAGAADACVVAPAVETARCE